MVLDISRILKSPGDSIDFDGTVDVDSDLFEDFHVDNVSQIAVKGIVKNISGVVVLEAEGTCTYSVPCDRCGDSTERKLLFGIYENFVKELEAESSPDALVLDGDTID